MFVRSIVFNFVLGICAVAGYAVAEVIVPTEEQTVLLRGSAEVRHGVRTVSGSVDATGHGPITYYTVPFQRGTFSLSWKSSNEDRVAFVFDGKANGKATHVLKVYVNGSPSTKKLERDTLTLVTYDGSSKETKKATIEKFDHHASGNEWHQLVVAFDGSEATVVVDKKSFVVVSKRFSESIEKCGVTHFSGVLETRDVQVRKFNKNEKDQSDLFSFN